MWHGIFIVKDHILVCQINIMNILRHVLYAIFACLLQIVITTELQAQNTGSQQFYTAPRETTEWVTVGNIENVKYECDLNSLIRLDSTHVRIHIKETPIRQNYYETVRAKMWEHRNIQEYSDSLRRKPEFCFEGYEHYGFTINEEKIEYNKGEYSILYSADYDLSGILLSNNDQEEEIEKGVAEKSPERMIINLFVKGNAKFNQENRGQ